MAKNYILRHRVKARIDDRVERLLNRIGNPEPPLDLAVVRDALDLDLGYFQKDDPSVVDDVISLLRVAGKQILKRPMLMADVVRKFDLRAFYLPDEKRILMDQGMHELKFRWVEAHEMGHSILPWHDGAMLGDDQLTLRPSCHEQMEAEANFAAARMLFLRERFADEARDYLPSLNAVKMLKPRFGNTYTTTFWRCVEIWGASTPIVGMVTGHPHPAKRDADFNPAKPCTHFVQSSAFASGFSDCDEVALFDLVADYCNGARGGPLGAAELVLHDDNGDPHLFDFETVKWGHALTLGVYREPFRSVIAV